MLIDLLKQAYEAMRYNQRRTIITVAGMAWGIATVDSAARLWRRIQPRDHGHL